TYATAAAVSITVWNIFLAWAVKSVLIKIGGIRLVNRVKPMFLGMMCGHAVALGLSILVDAVFFPGHGHTVRTGW
ncbi:MAG: hypothetical protein QGH20_11765, partial [Candidatus Latescibacteria bacterium]|nr:hypothetical protein [Candidatus Latescibacterota bacterium]